MKQCLLKITLQRNGKLNMQCFRCLLFFRDRSRQTRSSGIGFWLLSRERSTLDSILWTAPLTQSAVYKQLNWRCVDLFPLMWGEGDGFTNGDWHDIGEPWLPPSLPPNYARHRLNKCEYGATLVTSSIYISHSWIGTHLVVTWQHSWKCMLESTIHDMTGRKYAKNLLFVTWQLECMLKSTIRDMTTGRKYAKIYYFWHDDS
jgi:hypothetical protein